MSQETSPSFSLPNIPTPTMGGKQFWTDHCWRDGWRIQQNALTKHYRLIDPSNIRRAWGIKDVCENELDRIHPEFTMPNKSVFVLLHGLMRSSNSMRNLGEHLQEKLDSPVIYFEYASTRASIAEHAAALQEVLSGLPKDVEINLAAHSMGNIVIRYWLAELQRNEDRKMLERVKHIVMLGPPNQGSSIAKQLAKTGLFHLVTGAGGKELGEGWDDFSARLATPKCPFGIIAGRLPDNIPLNPLVNGQGDFVVSVEETKLAGAADFLEVPLLHSFIMDDPAVQQAVVRFVRTEKFH